MAAAANASSNIAHVTRVMSELGEHFSSELNQETALALKLKEREGEVVRLEEELKSAMATTAKYDAALSTECLHVRELEAQLEGEIELSQPRFKYTKELEQQLKDVTTDRDAYMLRAQKAEQRLDEELNFKPEPGIKLPDFFPAGSTVYFASVNKTVRRTKVRAVRITFSQSPSWVEYNLEGEDGLRSASSVFESAGDAFRSLEAR